MNPNAQIFLNKTAAARVYLACVAWVDLYELSTSVFSFIVDALNFNRAASFYNHEPQEITGKLKILLKIFLLKEIGFSLSDIFVSKSNKGHFFISIEKDEDSQ